VISRNASARGVVRLFRAGSLSPMPSESESVVAESRSANRKVKVAVMQPYFFPYLGYFHLMDAVDHFIVLDDVKYSKNSWVNRNRILINHEPSWLTVPVAKPGFLLREKRYLVDDSFFGKLNRKISTAYRSSSDRDYLLALLRHWARPQESSDSVAQVNLWMMKKVLTRLPVSCPQFHIMSSLNIRNLSDPVERIIRAVKTLGDDVPWSGVISISVCGSVFIG